MGRRGFNQIDNLSVDLFIFIYLRYIARDSSHSKEGSFALWRGFIRMKNEGFFAFRRGIIRTMYEGFFVFLRTIPRIQSVQKALLAKKISPKCELSLVMYYEDLFVNRGVHANNFSQLYRHRGTRQNKLLFVIRAGVKERLLPENIQGGDNRDTMCRNAPGLCARDCSYYKSQLREIIRISEHIKCE